MTEEKIKVILADDHALFRGGLKGLLDGSGLCEVTGEASDGEELLALLRPDSSEVVLLDIDMPNMDGCEAAGRALRMAPGLKIVVLSMHGEEDYYFKMVSLGVRGFLLKSSDIDEVLSAVSAVSKGGTYFSQELLQDLVGTLKTAPIKEGGVSVNILSERELEILLLICKGHSNQEIADRLFISKRTVDKHRANILEKTQCKNTANLVVFAIKNSLVEI